MSKWLGNGWLAGFRARRAEARADAGRFVLDDLFPLCFVVEFAYRGPGRRP